MKKNLLMFLNSFFLVFKRNIKLSAFLFAFQKTSYLLFVSMLFIFSCKKNSTETLPDVGYDYAPYKLGSYIIYDIDSTVYDDFFKTVTVFKYRIKEKLEEPFIDNQGRNATKLIRYIKKYNPNKSYDQMEWDIKDVWNCIKTQKTYEVVEENLRFIKLNFPIEVNKKWEGNIQNSLEVLNYKYVYVDKEESINGINFDKVTFVEQKDDKYNNLIQRQYYIEKYAKNIGLVYREIRNLYSNKIIPGTNVEQRIEKGVFYKQTYVSSGIE